MPVFSLSLSFFSRGRGKEWEGAKERREGRGEREDDKAGGNNEMQIALCRERPTGFKGRRKYLDNGTGILIREEILMFGSICI